MTSIPAPTAADHGTCQTSTGQSRWDVIHKIAELLVHHMYPTLTRQEPFDEAAYRAGLDALR